MAQPVDVSELVTIDTSGKPHQPRSVPFPARKFGKESSVQRSFQASWFDKWQWLHYDITRDVALCFICCKAVKDRRVKVSKQAEGSFLTDGFTNWKDATVKFAKHERSDFHKACTEALSSTVDIRDMLNKQAVTEKQANREYLLKVLSTVRFLARQGLALCGSGDDSDSNLVQLLHLRAEDFSPISRYLERKQLKYISHEVQNEFLSIMALQVLREIASSLQSAVFHTVMVDETTDMSNQEQVVLVFRWVDNDLASHEEFVGLYQTDSITSDALVAVIKDTLLRMQLKMETCRGQCYDGASSMSGAKKGVAKVLLDEEPRALYTHCYGHALNLAVGDCVKQCKLMKDTLDVVIEVSKLIKKSPKRDAAFDKLKAELAPETPGFRVLCPTRWTVRAGSLQSVIDNYEILLLVWGEALEGSLDGEMRARIIGVETQMKRSDFLFGICLGSLLLRHSDNLSSTLQHKTMSAAEGQHVANLTVKVLEGMRSDEQFAAFYHTVVQKQTLVGVTAPSLPRKRRAPSRFEVGSSSTHSFHVSPDDYYRQIYFEALDHVIGAIRDRFDQPGYKTYRNLEELVLKACKGESYNAELDTVCSFYGSDLSKAQLEAQLPLLRPLCEGTKEISIQDIVRILARLSSSERLAFSSVWTLMKLLLVMPATNASSERSFSALRRIKTYLRSTMSQQRLNSLMLLHVNRDKTDGLDLSQIGREFVTGREGRIRTFGNFQ